MIRLPIYGTKTLRLAFEFGLILSEVAKEQNVVLTKDIVARAQSVFINEINTKGFKKTALGFVPLILAVFETK
jgi:hypothetical protein